MFLSFFLQYDDISLNISIKISKNIHIFEIANHLFNLLVAEPNLQLLRIVPPFYDIPPIFSRESVVPSAQQSISKNDRNLLYTNLIEDGYHTFPRKDNIYTSPTPHYLQPFDWWISKNS